MDNSTIIIGQLSRKLSWVVTFGMLFLSLPDGRAQQTDSAVDLAKKFKDGADAYAAKNYSTTVTLYGDIIKSTQPSPPLEPVYYMIGAAQYGAGEYVDAEQSFQLYLKLYPEGVQMGDARVGLVRAWLKEGKLNEARDFILNADNRTEGIDDLRMGRSLELEVVDELIKVGRYDDALPVLQGVSPREDVLTVQNRRLAELKDKLNSVSLASGGQRASTLLGSQRECLAARLADAQEAFAAIEKDTAFDLPLYLRFGRVYLEQQKPWLALVAYREAYLRFPDAPKRSYALDGLIMGWKGVGRDAHALELCQEYLTRYPDGDQLPEVAFVAGQLSMSLSKPVDAVGYFGQVLRPNINPKLREQVSFLISNAKFASRDWAGARAGYKNYLSLYPSGEFIAQATYYMAMTYFLTGDFGEARGQIRQFTENFPQSALLPDAFYRLAVCAFSAKAYDEAIERTQNWERQFPQDLLLVDVLSMQGDALKALNRDSEAVDVYLRSARAAKNDAARSYALKEAARLLEKSKEWPRLAQVYKGFLETYPRSPLVLDWSYGLARVRLRQHQQADAVTALTSCLRPFLVDPTRDLVEKCLSLLAQQQARHRSAAAPAPSTSGVPSGAQAMPFQGAAPIAPTVVAAPPVAPVDALAVQLGFAANETPQGLVSARLEFYRYQVAFYSGQRIEAQRIMAGVGRRVDAAELSAPIMGLAGEALIKDGDGIRAKEFFQTLLKRYPASAWRDVAYVGLGDLALADGHADQALENYTAAVEKAGGEFRMREALMGQARCQLQLGMLDDAAKLFTRVAGERTWRGDATAESLYNLGMISSKQGDFARAINFYQRVYVGYARYPEWMARSYLQSAQLFEQIGKAKEAANTYREIIRTERLKGRPEVAVAKDSLAKLIVQ